MLSQILTDDWGKARESDGEKWGDSEDYLRAIKMIELIEHMEGWDVRGEKRKMNSVMI